ncbi:MAG: glycerol-3-phosphate acyltransferase [bacterium]
MSDTAFALALLAPVVGYLAGSILPAELVARRHGMGLRNIDSERNPGTSEIYRLYGPAAALLVFVLDAAKGILPVAAAQWLGVPWWSVALTAVAAVAGHCWSVYYRFWGGKGLATAAGIFAFMMPLTVLAVLPPSVFAWWKTRWVPASGMVGLPIILAVAWLYDANPAHKAAATIIPLVMLIREIGWIREQLAARGAPSAPAVHPSKESSSP